MAKYTTLVFRNNNDEGLKRVREMAEDELCMAWSMSHELVRLELIEQALDENDIEKAKSYIGETDVIQFLDRLNT